MRFLATVASLFVGGIGCEGGHERVIDLVTEFEPKVEFAAVRTEEEP